MEPIAKRNVAKLASNKDVEIFIAYANFLNSKFMTIDLAKEVQITLLLIKKVILRIEWANFIDIFSKKLRKMLPKNTGINKHIIELVNGKQPSYRLIYSLNLVELETFNIYIEINLA